jgi:hypothetical protein
VVIGERGSEGTLEKKMKQITLEYSKIRQEVQEIKKILKIKSLMISR